jgi:hypothetical protein
MIGVSFLQSNPLLIGLPITRGLVIANGEDGASEARWKGWNSYPHGLMKVWV